MDKTMASNVNSQALATQIAAVIESRLREAGYGSPASNDLLQASTLRLEGLLSTGEDNRRIHLVSVVSRF